MELTVAVETKSKKRNIIFSESSITAKLECETKNIINDYLPVVEDVRNDVVVVELC